MMIPSEFRVIVRGISTSERAHNPNPDCETCYGSGSIGVADNDPKPCPTCEGSK